MSYGIKTKKRLFRMYDKRCAYCGAKLKPNDFTLDHVYPKSKGGQKNAKNIKPSCRFCNSFKGNSSIRVFKYRLIQESKQDTDIAKTIRGKFDITPSGITFYFEKVIKEEQQKHRTLDKIFEEIKKERETNEVEQ